MPDASSGFSYASSRPWLTDKAPIERTLDLDAACPEKWLPPQAASSSHRSEVSASIRDHAVSPGAPIDTSNGKAAAAAGDSFAAWRSSHGELRALERALVVTIHAGASLQTHQDLLARIAAARGATQALFEEVSKGEMGAARIQSIGRQPHGS